MAHRRAIISAAFSRRGVDSARRNVFSSAPVLIWTGHGIAQLPSAAQVSMPSYSYSSCSRASRGDPSGCDCPFKLVPPARKQISRAHEHLRAAHARGQLGRFQLEAAIQAVHCARGRDGTTDWPALLALHRILQSVAPSLGSGVALAAVTAEVDGPAAGLATLDALLEQAGQPAGPRAAQGSLTHRKHHLTPPGDATSKTPQSGGQQVMTQDAR